MITAEMAAEAIGIIYNNSIPALQLAKQVFKQLNLNHKKEISNIFTTLSKKISGSQETGIAELDEEVTGELLAASICHCRLRKDARIGNVMGAKYKPVDKKKRPVPVSMPILKRQPYKPLPVPIFQNSRHILQRLKISGILNGYPKTERC